MTSETSVLTFASEDTKTVGGVHAMVKWVTEPRLPDPLLSRVVIKKCSLSPLAILALTMGVLRSQSANLGVG